MAEPPTVMANNNRLSKSRSLESISSPLFNQNAGQARRRRRTRIRLACGPAGGRS
jgi:hypothetical protein